MSTSGSSAYLSLTSPTERAISDQASKAAAGSHEEDIRRALRHHARALKALRGSAYETLSEATRSRLITKLEQDWTELKQRLRNLNSPSDEVRSDASDANGASSTASEPSAEDEGWISRLASGLR